jgi:predicted aminopeptidase
MVDVFYQTPLHPDSRDITAFVDSTGSVYMYTQLPQGCEQGTNVFSKFVSRVLSRMRYSAIACYLDDVAVFTHV